MNEGIEERLADLAGLLAHTLKVDDTISFDSLRLPTYFAPFVPPPAIAAPANPPPVGAPLAVLQRPFFLFAWLPWVRRAYERRVREAEARDEQAAESWRRSEQQRVARLERAKAEYESAKAAHVALAEQRNQEVDQFSAAYRSGDPEAIVASNTMVLERSQYPDGFEAGFRLGFVPSARELSVAYDLPTCACVPEFIEHRYVKARDVIEAKSRKASEVRSIYLDVIASICLRTIHELYEADQHAHIASIVFTGVVNAVDPATGQDVWRCLISARAKRDAFLGINLGRVEKLACVQQIGGRVSPKPDELQAVEPIAPYGSVEGLIELEEVVPAPKPKRGARA